MFTAPVRGELGAALSAAYLAGTWTERAMLQQRARRWNSDRAGSRR